MPRPTFYSCSSRFPQSTKYSYLRHRIYINVNKYNDKLTMLLFFINLSMKSLQNRPQLPALFGGRSKRESSCLEIRSSSQFLREILISYFARRILEGVFVRGIVHIRNECLFFSVHGKWIAVRNKQIASRFTRFVCSALRFISHEPRKKDTHSLIEHLSAHKSMEFALK